MELNGIVHTDRQHDQSTDKLLQMSLLVLLSLYNGFYDFKGKFAQFMLFVSLFLSLYSIYTPFYIFIDLINIPIELKAVFCLVSVSCSLC